MSIKQKFFEQLLDEIGAHDYFLVADVGYNLLEPIREKLGDRFINVGIREQAMISMASGLALSGKRVFTYTISSFYMRALEQIKLDIYGQKLDGVIMIGGGSPLSGYDNYGPSHKLLKEEIKLLKKYIPVIEVMDYGSVDLACSKLILLPR